MWFSMHLTAILLGLFGLSASQSPGPDWPMCAVTSFSHNPGWEVLDLRFVPSGRGQMQSTLYVALKNEADGSQTTCSLSKATSNGMAVVADDIIQILDSSNGGCETRWANESDEAISRKVDKPARVTFDISSSKLTVEQTWTCQTTNGQTVTLTGSASRDFDLQCFQGREDPGETCTLSSLHVIGYAPVYIGPAILSSPTGAQQPASDNCARASFSFPGWQIISMVYNPPSPQPEGSPYPAMGVRIEVRNLADGSRTVCYLESDDIDNADSGVTLKNEGRVLGGDGTFENGCKTGVMEVVAGSGGKEQQWEWHPTANVTFNTKTHEVSVEQKWGCAGMEEDAMEAYASLELEMTCQETGNELLPETCFPSETLYSPESGPVVVGFSFMR